MITANDAWNRILAVHGRIFRVTFITKTPQYGRLPNGRRSNVIVAPAGRTRTMVCRRLVQKFALGVISPEVRFAEDVAHDVLTVFDIQFFNNLRTHLTDQGMAIELATFAAGRRSYRRINMAEVVEITGA